jgi:hypothetical protein
VRLRVRVRVRGVSIAKVPEQQNYSSLLLPILVHRKMRFVVLILELFRLWRDVFFSGQARRKTEENAF